MSCSSGFRPFLSKLWPFGFGGMTSVGSPDTLVRAAAMFWSGIISWVKRSILPRIDAANTAIVVMIKAVDVSLSPPNVSAPPIAIVRATCMTMIIAIERILYLGQKSLTCFGCSIATLLLLRSLVPQISRFGHGLELVRCHQH